MQLPDVPGLRTRRFGCLKSNGRGAKQVLQFLVDLAGLLDAHEGSGL